MFSYEEVIERFKEYEENDFPCPGFERFNFPSMEADMTLIKGSKKDYPDALSFWIHAMNLHAKNELTQAGGHEHYLSYRDTWVMGAECKTVSEDDLPRIYEYWPDYEKLVTLRLNPVSQMIMGEEWNDKVMFFETGSEYGIYYWETGA